MTSSTRRVRGRAICATGLFVWLFGFAALAAAANRGCNKPLAVIYKQVAPAVVTIVSQTIRPYQFSNRVQQAEGSGFLFDGHGLILTNDHVIAGANAVQVTLDNGHTYPAATVGADALFDIAVLRIEVPAGEHLARVPLGSSSALQVGEDVVAIGNPLGLNQTLTHGVVSGLNRLLPDSPLSLSAQMMQTDAPINPGNSGGPLLNRCGEVVGINTAILAGAQNLGFAIPVDLAKSVLPSLLKVGHVVRPWLGFHGQLVDQDLAGALGAGHGPGLLVEAVDAGSPAARAGMRGGSVSIAINGLEYLAGGDLVTAINGVRLDSPQSLAKAIKTLKVGASVPVTYFRDNVEREMTYTIPERPPALDAHFRMSSGVTGGKGGSPTSFR